MKFDKEKLSQYRLKVMIFLRSGRFWRSFVAVLVGSLAGFLYYYFVGCKSGSCSITSDPYISALWGGLMGLFLINSPCSRGRC